MRNAAGEACVLARILLRFAAVAIATWQAVVAASRGGAWYALAALLLIIAVPYAAISVGMVWLWVMELRGVKGHS